MERRRKQDDESKGRFLSFVLRHRPSALGITLDPNGWADAEELIRRMNEKYPFTASDLERVVKNDDKQRYSFSEDGKRIRANQGHSINVDVKLEERMPPDVLYHGTAERFIESIMEKGLLPDTRLYVHLSSTIEKAICVGKRHGKPVVFRVDAGRMAEDGHIFYLSRNGVWLIKHVPAGYLELLS